MSLNSNTYIIGFAGAVCIVCSLFVSGAAVSLKEKQQENAKLDLQKNIISVSGLIPSKENGKEVDVNAKIASFSADQIKNFLWKNN